MTEPFALPSYSSVYDVVIQVDGFYDRLVVIERDLLQLGNVYIDVSMVPKVAFGQVRVVVTWGGNADLDLFVIKDRPVMTASSDFVWTEGFEMAGVELERFSESGFDGPETVLLENSTFGNYTIAVNVYSDYDGGDFKCAAADAACAFQGGERVEIYTEDGLMWYSTFADTG